MIEADPRPQPFASATTN